MSCTVNVFIFSDYKCISCVTLTIKSLAVSVSRTFCHTFHAGSHFPAQLPEKYLSPKVTQLLPGITVAVLNISKVKNNCRLFYCYQREFEQFCVQRPLPIPK